MKLRLRASAKYQVANAIRYYNRRRMGLGKEFREDINKAKENIKRNPRTWVDYKGGPLKMYIIPRFSYLVFYYINEEFIDIVRIAHSSQDNESDLSDDY